MEEPESHDIEVIGSSKANSLRSEIWRKLKKNRYAMAGLLVIGFATFIAIMGSLIRPDGTKDADESIRELQLKEPGFRAQILLKTENKEVEKKSFIMRMGMGGQDDGIDHIPFHSYYFDYPDVMIEAYNKNFGTPNYEPNYVRVNMADVVYNFSFDKQYNCDTTAGTVSFEDRLLGAVSTTFAELEQKIKAEHIDERIFVLGTDLQGRDILSRIMGGTIISLSVGFIAVLISLIIGITLGALAGYYRGWVDELIMWFINVIWSIPALLLVIAITLVLGKGFEKVFVAVGLTMWVEVARVVRGQVLSVREKEYIEAGKALGYRSGRIIFRHVIPNISGPIIVIAAANFASAILIEAGLSFLGIGTTIPTPSWGRMINDYKGFITGDNAYLALIPGICIVIMVLAFMLVGNGLRDALDTRSES